MVHASVFIPAVAAYLFLLVMMRRRWYCEWDEDREEDRDFDLEPVERELEEHLGDVPADGHRMVAKSKQYLDEIIN